MNKSLVTNLLALIVVLVAWLLPHSPGRDLVLMAGLFGLSGALTNWIAIHMLFERVPGLYGSGIIPNRFEEFKAGIRSLIMDNFFTEENFNRLARDGAGEELDLDTIAEKVDYDRLFDGLVRVITQSSFGGMLSLVGGSATLEQFREPFESEMRDQVLALLEKIDLKELVLSQVNLPSLRGKVEHLVDARLAELTPQKVKEIVQKMIRLHLGWLVVWGGVFGGLMGILSWIAL